MIDLIIHSLLFELAVALAVWYAAMWLLGASLRPAAVILLWALVQGPRALWAGVLTLRWFIQCQIPFLSKRAWRKLHHGATTLKQYY